jgi:mannan endo-1,4-beta-mannosidase
VSGKGAFIAARLSVIVAVVAVCAATWAALYAHARQRAEVPSFALDTRPLSTRHPYLGVFKPGAIASYRPVTSFAKLAGRQPNVVLYYSGWLDPFQIKLAGQAAAHNAIPFVQMLPKGIAMSSVASGEFDGYLKKYAGVVRDYGRPVIISFAPEPNGWWYDWGYTGTDPAQWIAAWRHVVTLFRQVGADNVTWLWTVNRGGGPTQPVKNWWPGARYVTWVGIDGYYFQKGDNFDGLFGPTIRAVRQLTHDPVFLSEIGIGQTTGQAAAMPNLFAGIRKYHLLGLVWFDVAQHNGIYHQEWQLDGHPAAIAAFRKEVRDLFNN